MYFVDFETHPIEGHLPPRPVGLAVGVGGHAAYYAFGHQTHNNCTEEEAKAVLKDLWGRKSLCFHNARFDYGVAVHHWGLPSIDPRLIHDTMALASLDPTLAGQSLALKTLSETRLNIPSHAQEELHQWIETQLKVKKNHGAYISQAPGDLVGRYACQDVMLTARLFEHFKGYATTAAYLRHQRTMPVLYRMEQRGIPVDSRRMLSFDAVTQQGLIEAQETARELIGLGPVNLNSPASLLNALLEQDLVDPAKLPRTRTGKLSSAADALTAAILNPELAEVLVEYKRLSKLTSGFLTPWQKQIAGDGRLHAQYRSIGATRTGRLSSAKPNMQQVPPVLREYLVPPKGKLWVSADYGQQELRILADLSKDRRLREIFASGADLHQQVADDLRITRKAAKAINFGIVYGAGPRRISQELGIGYDRAYQIMDSYFERFYGVSTWLKETSKAGDRGHVLQTLGGRKVQAEALFDPDYDGNRRYIGYKLPNMIIQGSGADMMLEAMINIDSIPGVELLTVVHDEANCAVDTPEQAEQIKEAMLAASAAVMSTPMTVDAEITHAWREG